MVAFPLSILLVIPWAVASPVRWWPATVLVVAPLIGALHAPPWAAVVLAPGVSELIRGGVVLRSRSLYAQATRPLQSQRRRDVLPVVQTLRFGTSGNREVTLSADELAHHVALIGTSGSGKTTTLGRLAVGVLELGWGVVIVDCKAGGLGNTARKLAKQYMVPLHMVDPDQSDTLGYNPCLGEPFEVSNKLLGAFSYGDTAEVYRLACAASIPIVVRALQATGRPVTLEAVKNAYSGGLGRLGREAGEPYREPLAHLAEQKGIAELAHSGLAFRLGALLEGKYGGLLRMEKTFDWDTALGTPSVTYFGLSATAASEDVELMGRVLAQDAKSACARRLGRLAKGDTLVPSLFAWDEFAALGEAPQLRDFLLQSRQAQLPTVISTQYIPEDVGLRKAFLSSGLIISHRSEGEDAEVLAKQYGTAQEYQTTAQIDFATGAQEKGSVRRVEGFRIHPNQIKEMPIGQAALRSVHRAEPLIVKIYP